MNVHEYQAKQLFARYGMPVPVGEVVPHGQVDTAVAAAKRLGGDRFVIKAQVHAGGRGKAGGVQLVQGLDQLAEAMRQFPSRLVTYQTDQNGQPVHHVLIEKTTDIARELYLGAVVDRALQRIVIMASTEGGMDIEQVAHEHPERIFKCAIDPLVGLMPFQARALAFQLGLPSSAFAVWGRILDGLYRLFTTSDLSLVEINPLVVTPQGDLICLDGKINLDDNALYRQKELAEWRDETQEDPRENHARKWDLNYIALSGNIGCMVNGAGLAMATMDMIKLHGGEPANFLDVGGGATQERVTEAFQIILSDPHVQAILVNIFGGIVRCDLIADGILGAVEKTGVQVPVVVRLEGNNAELGAQKLQSSGLNVIAASGLRDAAEKVVAAVNKGASGA